MANIAKAVVALLSSGGMTGMLTAFNMPLDVATPVVAALTAALVWLVPNTKSAS
jgi:hypothetical protein